MLSVIADSLDSPIEVANPAQSDICHNPSSLERQRGVLSYPTYSCAKHCKRFSWREKVPAGDAKGENPAEALEQVRDVDSGSRASWRSRLYFVIGEC
jgi:hypothetical protein